MKSNFIYISKTMAVTKFIRFFIFTAVVAAASNIVLDYTMMEQSSMERDEDSMLINTASINLNFTSTEISHKSIISIYTRSDNCFNCSWYKVEGYRYSTKRENVLLSIDAQWPLEIQLIIELHNLTCNSSLHQQFREHTQYESGVFVNSTDEQLICEFGPVKEVKRSANPFIPIAVLASVLIVLSILYTAFLKITKYFHERQNATTPLNDEDDLLLDVTPANTDVNTVHATRPQTDRIKSIDAFRGLSIVVMIFVNYRGGYYWFFHHAAWNGITVADLVFPWFMFIMGVSMTISIENIHKKSVPLREVLYKIIRRTLILFFLGLLISNSNSTWSTLRIPGVLQRFALTYFITAILQYAFHIPEAKLSGEKMIEESRSTQYVWFRDVIAYWKQWLIMTSLEVIWLCLTFLMPVPGCPTGYIGPGGLSTDKEFENCTGGSAGYIDKVIFGENHIYGHPTCKNVYFPMFGKHDKVHFDPEGLLGTINSCLIVFFGLQAGKIFLYFKTHGSRIRRFLIWAFILGVISACLTKCSQNDGPIPVNKNLWSLSFATTLSCMAFVILTIFYYLIDVANLWTGIPLHFVGMNSILVYVGHEIMFLYLLFNWGLTNYATHAKWIAMSSMGALEWVLIAYYCFKVNFFVKI